MVSTIFTICILFHSKRVNYLLIPVYFVKHKGITVNMIREEAHYKIGNWLLNAETGLLKADEPIELTSTLDHTPLRLLLCLIKYKSQDVSKSTMLQEVWPTKVVSEDVLSVAISQIRKSLGDNAREPEFIKTIPSVGYRLIAPVFEVEHHKNSNIFSFTTYKRAVVLIGGMLLLLVAGMHLNTSLFTFSETTAKLSEKSLEDYQLARYLLVTNSSKNLIKAEQLFEKILISNTDFSPVYLDLVDTRLKRLSFSGSQRFEQLEEFDALIHKSLTLDPNQSFAYLLKAKLAFEIEWNFEKAQQYFTKALELNDQDGNIHFQYSQFLLAIGDFENAIDHTNKYIQLTPASYSLPSVAWIYNMMGDYPRALKELNKLKAIEPNTLKYHISAQAIYENMGREKESFDELVSILTLKGYSDSALSDVKSAFNRNGLAGVNLWLLEVKKETMNIGQYTPPLSFARYALKAKKVSLAKKFIAQALNKKQTQLLWFHVDPTYKTLQEDHSYTKPIIKFIPN